MTLSAIARDAGLAQSNVHRYFESREQILLEILIEDEEPAWLGELERALAPLAGSGDAAAVAAAVARTIAARPATCALIAGSPPCSSTTCPATVPRHSGARSTCRSGSATPCRRAPRAPARPPESLIRSLHALVAGLWPMANPAPPVAAALARPQLRPLRVMFESDLRGALAAMLRGLCAG